MLKAVNTKDPKEVTVTLPEDSEVTAEDLKEQTITMTDKDKNVIEATFKEITEDGKVIFTAEKALEDAVEYKVTADWATFEKDTFTAQVKEAYVKNLAPASTVLLVEKATEENENKVKKVEIPVQAFDQYGKEIAMNAIAEGAEYKIKKGSAFIGAMPLTDKEITIDSAKETVTVTHTALKKGETIKFVVELVEKDKEQEDVVKFEAPFVYDDLRDEEPIVDSVTLTTEGGTSLAYDEKVKDSKGQEVNKEIKLHADVRNQYNSKMTEDLRWVVNGEVQTETGAEFSIASSEKPGEYKVQVFSTTDASKFDEVTITISDAPIRELKAETELKNIEDEKNKVNEKIFNKEQLQLGTIEANEGAKLTPEQLKFEVIVTDDKLSKDDIQVTAEYEKGEDGKETEKIIVKAKTDKAGTYKVIPYVGNSYTDKAAVKAENAFEVTTTVNPEIATIEEIKFDPTKLKSGQEIKEEIVIKNKHGERLTAAQVKGKIDVVSSKPEVVDTKEKEEPIVQGTTDADKDKTYLVLQAGETAGTAVVTVQSTENTSVLQTYTLDFVKAELAKVKLAQKTVKGVVAGDEEDKAQYNEVQFLDQHGLEIEEEGQAKVVDADGEEVTDVKAEVVKGAFDKEGNFVEAEKANSDKDLKDQVKQYVKVSAKDAKEAGNYTVIVAAKGANLTDEKTITGKFDVEVGAPRTVKDITLAPKSSTVATGAEAKVTVNLVDQYGEPYTLKDEETLAVQLIDKKDETIVKDDVTYEEVKEGKEGTKVVPGAYEIVLPMDKSGDYELVVAFGKDDDKKSESVAIKVGQASELVDKVAITGKHVEGNKATVKLKDTDKEGMTLGLDAFDEDGNKVNIDAKEINWSSSNETVATVENGVVTVAENADLKEDQKVTITADLKGKKSTVDIVVSAEDSKVQKDTLVAKMEENEKAVEVTEVTIDEKAVDGKVALTFTAVDQYGNDLTIKGEQFSILESMNSEVFTVAKPAEGESEVVITATGKGEANLRAKVDAEEVHVRIIVKEEAVVIAQDAKTLADALPKVPGVKEDKPLTIEGKDTNPSAKAVKEAVETKIDAEKNGIAVEVVNANDPTDVARSTQEDVDGQGTEKEITTVEYKVTLSKGDAEKQELTVYAQFVLDPETEAANALTKAKEEAISQLKQEFPAENYTGTGEGDAGNKEAYDKAMKAAEEAINAATDEAAVATALTEQQTELKKVKTNNQLEKEENQKAADAALVTAAAVNLELKNEDAASEDVLTQDEAVAAIKKAIEEALKGESEEAFAGKVEVTVETEEGFKAATNGTSDQTEGVEGSIKFKITITVGEGDVEGKATSKEAKTLTIAPKAFVSETDDSGKDSGEGTSEGSQTDSGTSSDE